MDQSRQEVVELVANLDDISGEVLAAAAEAMMEAGALDVWTTPIGMKKGRPGVMLSVLCEPEKREMLARRLIEQTGSFGVRYHTWGRMVLERRHETVETDYGPVRVKVGALEGRILAAKPEYEDVRGLAAQAGVAVRRVMSAARAAVAGWLAERREGGRA